MPVRQFALAVVRRKCFLLRPDAVMRTCRLARRAPVFASLPGGARMVRPMNVLVPERQPGQHVSPIREQIAPRVVALLDGVWISNWDGDGSRPTIRVSAAKTTSS